MQNNTCKIDKEFSFNRFKCAIFDLDGTLIDSTDVWAKVDIEFLTKRGLEVTQDFIRDIKTHTFESGSRYVVDKYNLDEKPEDIAREWFDMAKDAYENDIILKPNVKKFLDYLKNKGIKLCVATSSDRCLYEKCLIRNGIYDMFEDFTQTNEVTRGKEYPDVYLLAAKKAKVSVSECIVFEDVVSAVKGAKAGGFYTVGVADKGSYNDKSEIIKCADAFIENYEEFMLEG